MPTCGVCASTQFTPHDGFYYCIECQTQSQDFRQLEISYRLNASYSTIRSLRERRNKSRKQKPNRLGDGPPWTSWHAFNHIIKGMTDELMTLGAPPKTDTLILRLWACYLNTCEVAFTSKFQEVAPKLGFPFKYRDGKVLYDVDTASSYSRDRESKRMKKRKRKRTTTAVSAISIKKKMQKSDYESQLSSSHISSADEDNTTLESLNHSSTETKASSKLKIPRRKHLSKKGYKKRLECGGRGAPKSCTNGHMMTKSKALTLLHIALIVSRSQIQLSDLLRFIREGHLSYHTCSQFLPLDIKFGMTDINFINCMLDSHFPKHLALRKLLAVMSRRLKFLSLPTPDLRQLLRRYATDLLLPDGLSDLAVIILAASRPPVSIKGECSQKPMISFELLAIAPLLVLMKLLLGMDGVTERNASHFADTINRLQPEARLFSFRSWQRAVECRRVLLSQYHYPSREQTDPDAVLETRTSTAFLQNAQLDPHLRNRLYNGKEVTGAGRKMEKEVEKVLDELRAAAPRPPDAIPHFYPSLTPGLSLIYDVITSIKSSGKPNPPWVEILEQDWHSFDVQYLTKPHLFSNLLAQHNVVTHALPSDWLDRHMSRVFWVHDKMDLLTDAQLENKFEAKLTTKKPPKTSEAKSCDPRRAARPVAGVVTGRCDHAYWRLTPSEPEEAVWTMKGFEEDVMPMFAASWAWLLTQCSAMLHISTRDIYLQVLEVEETLLRKSKRRKS